MKKITLTCIVAASLFCPVVAATDFTAVADWLKLPAGRENLGNMHGDVAVSSAGEVYVSVQDPTAGLQVYAPDGTFVRNVPNAPSDFHGFVIKQQPQVGCLSTLETTHELLVALERSSLDRYQNKTQLLGLFDRMQEFQIRCAADPARVGYRHQPYGKPEDRVAITGRRAARRNKYLPEVST